MKIVETPLAGLVIVESAVHRDERGTFARAFCAHELAPLLDGRQIAQINHSSTRRAGTVRGLHFQYPPHSEMKLVRCVRGRVWDVAVDLRAGAPTFLQWYARELSPESAQMMVVPEGFAHGFQVLEPDSEVFYLCTEFYRPSSEGGIRHDDPRLAIAWPLAPLDLSDRDRGHPLLDDDFTGIAW